MGSVLRCALVFAVLAAAFPSAARPGPLTNDEIQASHKKRVEALKQLSGIHEKFRYAVHTLIVPPGAIANYKFPVPVARIRYEAVPLFAFDDAQVRADARAIIEDLSRQFKADKNLERIAVVGHTDSVGADPYNYELSLRRALSVANILRLAGMPSERITVVGLGESYPIASNEDHEGRSLNRRVEFFLASIPDAVTPSIQGPGFDPKLRNNHDPGCREKTGASGTSDANEDCGKTSINKFPTHKLTTEGKLRPTGEVITVTPKPEFPVREIPERDHVPVGVNMRSHP